MAYRVGNPPPDATAWTVQELRKIEQAQTDAVDAVYLRTLYAAPDRLREGMTVLADGTTWNPGAGQGVYTYYAAAWHKLG